MKFYKIRQGLLQGLESNSGKKDKQDLNDYNGNNINDN